MQWLFIPVETEEDVRDVQQLIEMRARAKRLLKLRGFSKGMDTTVERESDREQRGVLA